MLLNLVIMAGVALLAFAIKGATGFGAAITLVALGALFFGVADMVVAATILDLFSGILMLRITSASDVRGYWLPLLVAIAVGSVLGSLTLLVAPAESLGFTIGCLVTALGVWFLAGRPGVGKGGLSEDVPERASWKGHAVSMASGFTGGFIGMSGPPLVFYLGSWMGKVSFRRVLIPLLLAAAAARFIPYIASGLVTTDVLLIAAAGLPPLLIGPWIGDKVFKRLNEKWFGRAVGVLLVVIGVKWLLM